MTTSEQLLAQVNAIVDELEADDFDACDWLNEQLNIETIFRSYPDNFYQGAEVLCAFGGPGIWVDTRYSRVEGHWGNDHFTRSYENNSLDEAIEQYIKAVEINPAYSLPYNQLGYAHQLMENFTESEKAFKKSIELIPEDPNPYDSYGELLMKMGNSPNEINDRLKRLAPEMFEK